MASIKRVSKPRAPMTYPTIEGAIGNTPLVRLRGPSGETGCEIFGKCAPRMNSARNENGVDSHQSRADAAHRVGLA